MRILVSALAFVLAAKLVIMTANGVAITDYPSMERCERAWAELQRAWLEEAKAKAPTGYHVVVPPTLTAICVPA
jgi:hypothetical protein